MYSQEVKNMSRMKIVGAAVAAFFGVASAASAGVVYESEFPDPWFTVTASGADLSGTGWTKPAGCDAEVSDGKIVFEADVDSPLKYQPSPSSGPVALVNVRLVVDPNATIPGTEGLTAAQAALTVVTNTSLNKLVWYGLVRGSSAAEWIALDGATPTAGSEYDVRIALDNTSDKRIKYSVSNAGADAYVDLATNSVSWFANPKTDKTSVEAVAFAGAGSVGNFSGVSLEDDGASIALAANGEVKGFDFTNGTIKAVVTLPSVNASGSTRTPSLVVVDFASGTITTNAASSSVGNEYTWDLSNLTAGGTYGYTLIVKSGDTVREVKSGSFAAANWDGSYWFSATNNVVDNGSFDAGAVFADGKWGVSGDANFTVANIAPGSNAVSRVDTTYSFETFIDAESLESLTDAVGGLVAVSDNYGSWYAYTGSGAQNGWAALSGGIAPEANTEYVIRAEFDFQSLTHRVRYLVKKASDPDTAFASFALNGAEWINLPAGHTAGSLSSVGMSGKGYVKAIFAEVADRAVAESNGVKYNTLWEALRNGNGTVTLLHSATLKPSEISGGKFGPYTINVNGCNYVVDFSQLTGKWQFVQRGDVWYLLKPGATYIFF